MRIILLSYVVVQDVQRLAVGVWQHGVQGDPLLDALDDFVLAAEWNSQ